MLMIFLFVLYVILDVIDVLMGLQMDVCNARKVYSY